MKTESKKETSETTALVTVDFFGDAGMGMEGVDKSSFAIPFIGILQGLSPQIETVDGAKPGLFINTVTNELFKEVLVIPCAFQRRYLRWAPRSEGGGYKGEYNPLDVESGKVPGLSKAEDGRLTLEGDELKDTRNHFVLFSNGDGNWRPALISLSSSQIKKSKRWMSRIQGLELKAPNGKSFNPPSFSHIYRLTPAKEENKKGSWWGMEIDLVSKVADAEVYQKAKDFNISVLAGEVKAATPEESASASDAESGHF